MEASHAIRANPFLIILPPLQGGALILLTTVIAVTGAFVITAGEIDNIPGLNLTITTSADLVKTKYVNFSYAEVGSFYLFLGYLWSLNFINGITVMVSTGELTCEARCSRSVRCLDHIWSGCSLVLERRI